MLMREIGFPIYILLLYSVFLQQCMKYQIMHWQHSTMTSCREMLICHY